MLFTKLFEKPSDPILIEFLIDLMAIIAMDKEMFKPLSGEVIMLSSQ